MTRINNAKKALRICLGYKRAPGGVIIQWSGQDLFFPCDESERDAFAVGCIHSMICHNVDAILDEKITFHYQLRKRKYILPVQVPLDRHTIGAWHYVIPDSGWRPAEGSKDE